MYLNDEDDGAADKSGISALSRDKGKEKKVFNFKQQKFIEVTMAKQKHVYVTKWLRTKHAVMFRLNVKLVQVCFLD